MPDYVNVAGGDSQSVVGLMVTSADQALTPQEAGVLAGLTGGYTIVGLVLAILVIVGLWKMFKKAGQPGWASLIPIYNVYILIKIAGRPWWWLLLLAAGCIPFVGWIVAGISLVILYNDIAKSFGRGIGTTLGLIFFSGIFLPILGLGKAQYVGPAAAKKA
jgi:hypothetical protein